MWDWEKNNVLEGTLEGAYYGIGQFKSTIFHILEKKSDKIQSVWGHSKIVQALRTVEKGSYVRIKYLGMKKTGTKNLAGKPKIGYDYEIVVRPKKAMGKLGTGGRKSK